MLAQYNRTGAAGTGRSPGRAWPAGGRGGSWPAAWPGGVRVLSPKCGSWPTLAMANHHATDSRSVRGSGARTAALGETGQDSSSAGVAGADRATDGRRQERHGGSRATWHDPRDRGQVAAAVSARRLRWLAGRAAPGSAAHDRGRRRGAGGGAGNDCYALEHALDGEGVWAGKPHLACVRSEAAVARPSSVARSAVHREGRDVLYAARARGGVVRGRRRWLERSQTAEVQASQSGAPTTTAGTEPPRCLRPWT